MLNTEKLKTIKNNFKHKMSKYRIRDAKTDEYVIGLMDRDFILPGRVLIALFGLGFIFGIIFIVLCMCTFM